MLLTLLLACQDYDVAVLDRTDAFAQDPADKVDILLVVDNSASMMPYQNKLSQHFSSFIQYFVEANTDYHIGVTSTTLGEPLPPGTYDCTVPEFWPVPEDGELAGPLIIAPGTPNAELQFEHLVQLGTCGSGAEAGMAAALASLTDRVADGSNAGFLREDAPLSIIFVSDEQDSSLLSPIGYAQQFQNLKRKLGRDSFVASALVSTTEEAIGCDDPDFPPNVGSRYIELAELTGGIVGDICSSDFEPIVQKLGLAASSLETTFYLSQEPSVGTLEVRIDEEEAIPCDAGIWYYDRVPGADGDEQPAIVFYDETVPPPSAQITVYYEYGGGVVEDFCQ
jgi:hypothetical protein